MKKRVLRLRIFLYDFIIFACLLFTISTFFTNFVYEAGFDIKSEFISSFIAGFIYALLIFRFPKLDFLRFKEK